MTQPQPHQRSFPEGDSDWAPADAARILRAREEGPRSPVLPVLPFASSRGPADLATVVDILLASSSKDPAGGVTLPQLLVVATSICRRMADATGGNDTHSKLVSLDPRTGERTPASALHGAEAEMMMGFNMIMNMVCDALESLTHPLVAKHLQEAGITPESCASTEEFCERAWGGLIGDRMLEALQVTREELREAGAPSVDS